MSARRSSTPSAGFTLIEVMVALAILAALSVLTAGALRSGIENRAILQADINRDSMVEDTLRIIHDDVGAAYHHRDIAVAMLNELAKPPATNQGQQGPGGDSDQEDGQAPGSKSPGTVPGQTEGANPAQQGQQDLTKALGTPRPTPVQMTGFVGEEQAMYFTVLNHVRTTRDAKESDQAKVGYYLKQCRSRDPKAKQATQCLFRSLSTVLDDDVTKIGPESVLLENVTEFKLRYLGPEHEDFVEKWVTGQNGDATTKENFPYAVEVTLTMHNKNDPKEKPVSKSILAPIRFPNNPKKDQKQDQQGKTKGV